MGVSDIGSDSDGINGYSVIPGPAKGWVTEEHYRFTIDVGGEGNICLFFAFQIGSEKVSHRQNKKNNNKKSLHLHFPQYQ